MIWFFLILPWILLYAVLLRIALTGGIRYSPFEDKHSRQTRCSLAIASPVALVFYCLELHLMLGLLHFYYTWRYPIIAGRWIPASVMVSPH